MGRKTVVLLALALAVLWPSAGLGAQEDEEEQSRLPRTKWLGERGPSDPRPYENVLLGTGLLNRKYFDWKNRLWVEHGISFGGYFSSNVQWGSEGGPSHSISETLLLFTWEPVRDEHKAGRLVVGFAHDRTFGRPTTREFADFQNLVETPNDLDTHPDLTFSTLGLLHWEQEWWTGPDHGWGLRAGQIYAPSYFGSARYLDDDRRFFMARPLATAGAAQWVGYNDIGLGINGIAWKDPFYVSLAFIDSKANRQYPDVPSFFDGRFLYLGEIGFERDVDGPNEATLRLTVSHLDLDDGDGPGLGPGQSLMLSGDKRFDGRWALAGRWSRSFERLSADYQELFSLGVMLLLPSSPAQDIVGFGVFTGEPSVTDRGWESGAEVFYRIQLTQAVGLMPDVQYWLRDDRDSESARSWVFGLRMEFEF